MNKLIGIALTAMTLNAQATKLDCRTFNIELDETSLKTTITSVADGASMVSYAILIRSPKNSTRTEFLESYELPSGRRILKNNSAYAYSRKNANGQFIDAEVTCRIERH